jgi:hypothetical protein
MLQASKNILGMGVFLDRNIPEFASRMTLSETVTVSDEFRVDFQAWLDDFFGRERVWYIMDGKLYCHPNNYDYLKRELKETPPPQITNEGIITRPAPGLSALYSDARLLEKLIAPALRSPFDLNIS